MRFAAAHGRAALALGAAAFVVLSGAGSAGAQQISIGGTVADEIQLSASQPTGFATFPRQKGDHVYTVSIDATVTTTDAPTYLSVADGGTGPVARRGHLVSVNGSSVLPLPLQVSGSSGDLESLDQPIPPVLASWTEPVSSADVTMELSQEVDGTAGLSTGPSTKEVMVTLSTDAP